MDREGL